MARAYATKVHAATARFPRKEDYGLTSQLNRAANSISLNIAEGAARSTNKGFGYHLEISVGSTFEVVSRTFLALDRSYIDKDEQQALYDEGEVLAKSINAFRRTLR